MVESGESHPKLRATRELLEEHVRAHGDGSRAMVFTSLRDSVDELVPYLQQSAMLRVAPFVGQQNRKGRGKMEGSRGLPQKRQREVVRQFTQGDYNVLVSTSIGEEVKKSLTLSHFPQMSHHRHIPFSPAHIPRRLLFNLTT